MSHFGDIIETSQRRVVETMRRHRGAHVELESRRLKGACETDRRHSFQRPNGAKRFRSRSRTSILLHGGWLLYYLCHQLEILNNGCQQKSLIQVCSRCTAYCVEMVFEVKVVGVPQLHLFSLLPMINDFCWQPSYSISSWWHK